MPHQNEKTLIEFGPFGFEHVVMVGRQSSDQAAYTVRPHYHPGIFEFHTVARGQVSYMIGGVCHTMRSGDALLIQPDVPHGTLEEPLGRCERYWLQLRVPAKGRSLLGLPPEPTRILTQRLSGVSTRPFHGSGELVPIFDRLLNASSDSGRDPLQLVNLRNLALRLLLDFLELSTAQAASPKSVGISKAIGLIERSLAPVPLAELAREAGMSESTFKVQFRKVTGLPPMEFASRHRIEQARRLLLATKRPVTDLAHDLGFSTSQHFATVFRRHTGRTPVEFRSGMNAAHWADAPSAGAGAIFSPLIHLRPRGQDSERDEVG